MLRFELTTGGDAFVDPATVRLAFTLKNLGDKDLRLLSNSPLCHFQRLRILAKGQLVEDISYLHRLEEMFDISASHPKAQVPIVDDDGGGW